MHGPVAEPLLRSITLAMALLLLLSSWVGSETTGAIKERLIFEPSGVSVTAEKADSPEKRARGLMNRTSLGAGEAMIFLFEETGYHSFWMYNTLIPLTILFLDEGFNVVDIQDMAPCRNKDATVCPVYVPRKQARYAIEVNQGFTAKHGIAVGDHVTVARDKKKRIGK